MAKTRKAERGTLTIDRRKPRADERRKCDRRKHGQPPVAAERRSLERRAKVSRRRQIDPTTCERDYSVDEVEFMNAMNEYKRNSGRMFPTCSEVLEVLRSLGYVKQPGAAHKITMSVSHRPESEQDSED